MKHANIAFFIPHNGCPQQCSFCNQKSITGRMEQPTPAQVHSILEQAAQQRKGQEQRTEIAFFGGSFTAIDADYQKQLLQTAAPFVADGSFSGIRISTRPDAITKDILEMLAIYGVTSIELGAQSMEDRVLGKNRRGHTVQDVENASRMIQDAGFSLGLQMMTGLYGSTWESDWQTARRIAQLQPETVRIYPTVVMKGTALGELYLQGRYVPPSLEETVKLCAELLEFFEGLHIPVIRLGLHDSPQLHQDALAGAVHPALRELCESQRMLEKVKKAVIKANISPGELTIQVSPGDISRMIGQKKSNLAALKSMGYHAHIVEDAALSIGEYRIQTGLIQNKKEKQDRKARFSKVK